MKKILLLLLSAPVLFAAGSGEEETAAPERREAENIWEMARSGDRQSIETLLNIDFDETDESGQTALHWAADAGNTEIVDFLILRGAELDPADNSGQTPLFKAYANGHSGAVRRLVDAGADISVQDAAGESAASMALQRPADQLGILLSAANINRTAVDRMPLLHAAASAGLSAHLQVLLDAGADPAVKDSSGMLAVDRALLPPVDLTGIRSAEILLSAGSPAPGDPQWAYIEQPLKTGSLEQTFEYGSTALHMASEHGQESMVRFLIDLGADVNARDQPGNTALHTAVRNGYRSIASLLLDAGTDVNVKDYNGNAPIHESLTASDDFAATRFLLAEGADSNIRNEDGSTPLHMVAMLRGNADGARLLISHGALIDPRDRMGDTPLMLAVLNENRELAEFLLSEGARIYSRNNSGMTPAAGALSHGTDMTSWFFTGRRLNETDDEGLGVLHHLVSMPVMENTNEKLSVLLNAGAQPDTGDSNGETPLFYAVVNSNISQAQILMDRGASLFSESSYGRSPLLEAFDQGPDFTVRLLEGRINTADTWGNTALFHAVRWERPQIAAALTQAGADTGHKNRQGNTPLHEAVRAGSAESVVLLLRAGGSPDTGNSEGQTPFHEAALWNNQEILDILLKRGADPDARDRQGKTAMHLAGESGNSALVLWLTASGVQTEVRDNQGETPLFSAVKSGHAETLQVLLGNGAQLQTRNRSGQTPLHAAVAAQQMDAARFLIAFGADVFASDAAGKTPFTLALEESVVLRLISSEMVNLQDHQGNTPLHLCAAAGAEAPVIRELIRIGADTQARNAMGQTPLDMALAGGHQQIAGFLM